jgi:bifunctional N-acetylglucosamine-1-phosphate-uridyltransferase/glucosamine-1-phosphate-acetyltransferase GlmU-like protein
MRRLLVVPAAGLGSRLQAASPKALVPVSGRPMLDHLVELTRPFVDAAAVIAHPSFSPAIDAHVQTRWRRHLSVHVLEQARPTGMLDAILAAGPAVAGERPDAIWIVWCDQVGLLPSTMARLAAAGEARPTPALVLPTVWRNDPYIHFERDLSGRIIAVRQRREGDDMPPRGESDMGLFGMTRQVFDRELQAFARDAIPGTGTGERNFLPFVPWLAERATVATISSTDAREAVGVNTPEELRAVEEWLRTRAIHP